ncbi:hypothetical protein Droror1_Dr00023463 [Drosera rotundifolia]
MNPRSKAQDPRPKTQDPIHFPQEKQRGRRRRFQILLDTTSELNHSPPHTLPISLPLLSLQPSSRPSPAPRSSPGIRVKHVRKLQGSLSETDCDTIEDLLGRISVGLVSPGLCSSGFNFIGVRSLVPGSGGELAVDTGSIGCHDSSSSILEVG